MKRISNCHTKWDFFEKSTEYIIQMSQSIPNTFGRNVTWQDLWWLTLLGFNSSFPTRSHLWIFKNWSGDGEKSIKYCFGTMFGADDGNFFIHNFFYLTYYFTNKFYKNWNVCMCCSGQVSQKFEIRNVTESVKLVKIGPKVKTSDKRYYLRFIEN